MCAADHSIHRTWEQGKDELTGGVSRASRSRRVLVVAYHFPPSKAVGAQSCAQIARYFPEHGWEPVVLTARVEEYDDDMGWDRSKGATFQGTVLRTGSLPHPYRIHRRMRSWIRTKRVDPEPGDVPTWRTSWPGRHMLALLEVPDRHTGWFGPAVLKGLTAVRRHRVECLVSSAPAWTNHVVGVALRRLTGLPLVVHYRDPWTQVGRWKPRSQLSDWIERRLEGVVIRSADAVVCVTDRHRALLQKLHPDVMSERFITITNGYDEHEWRAVDVDSARGSADNSAFVITYTGALYQNRSPYPLFRAVRRLGDRGVVDLNRVRIDLIGWCEVAQGRSVRAVATEVGVGHCVRIVSPVGRKEALRRAAASGLLLVLAEDWMLQVPAKTYEYLRAGPPILALTGDGALADLLRGMVGAFVVDPGRPEDIERAVADTYSAWADGMVQRRRDAGEIAPYERRALAARFADLLTSVCDPSAPRRDERMAASVTLGR